MTRTIIAAAAAALALSACASQPAVRNIENAPVGAGFTEDLGQVVERALAKHGWTVDARRPGAVDASHAEGSRRAAVTITYDRSSYDITYKDSSGLGYADGKIDRSYNTWVDEIAFEIETGIALASVVEEKVTRVPKRQVQKAPPPGSKPKKTSSR